MPLPIWIVVANGSRARLLQRAGHGEPLTELKDWAHPATRKHPHNATDADRQSGIRGRSGLAERQTPQDKERDTFAHEICLWLSHAINTQQVGNIALLSSNPFLGDLVAHGQGHLHRHLSAVHAVDLTHLPLSELEDRLQHDFHL